MSLTKINKKEWTPLHTKVFSRWVSNRLNKTKSDFSDITKEFTSGITLIQLATSLTKNKITNTNEISQEQKQNLDLAVNMFEKDGVNLAGISSQESENNKKFYLGLLWNLILHYSIQKSVKDMNKNNHYTNFKKS